MEPADTLAEQSEMDWSNRAQVELDERKLSLLNILRLAEALASIHRVDP